MFKNKKLKSLIKDFQDNNQQLGKKFQNIQNEYESIKNSIDNSNTDQQTINQQNESELNCIRSTISNISSTTNSLSFSFNNFKKNQQETNQQTESSLKSINSTISSIKNTSNSLSYLLNSFKKEQQKINKQNETSIKSINNSYVSLNDEIDSKIDSLNDEIESKIDSLNDEIDSKTDSLNDEIDSLNEKLSKIKKKYVKEDTIKSLKKEFSALKKQINDVDNSDYSLIIPYSQYSWSKISITKYCMTSSNKTFTVISSSTWRNQDDHAPYNLFNGLDEKRGGKRWASNEYRSSSIIIGLSWPEKANVLIMMARDDWYCQAPTSFAIFAGDSQTSFTKLKDYCRV